MHPTTWATNALAITLLSSLAWASKGTGPAVGSVAPDFTAYSFVTGERTRLSDQRGKVVILTFWATWCAPCRQELPNLEGIQEHVGRDKLVVLAMSFKDSDETMRYLKKNAKQSGWKLTMLVDPHGDIADRYGIHSIPHMLLIGRDGSIAAIHSGFGDDSLNALVPEINALLTGKPVQVATPQ